MRNITVSQLFSNWRNVFLSRTESPDEVVNSLFHYLAPSGVLNPRAALAALLRIQQRVSELRYVISTQVETAEWESVPDETGPPVSSAARMTLRHIRRMLARLRYERRGLDDCMVALEQRLLNRGALPRSLWQIQRWMPHLLLTLKLAYYADQQERLSRLTTKCLRLGEQLQHDDITEALSFVHSVGFQERSPRMAHLIRVLEQEQERRQGAEMKGPP